MKFWWWWYFDAGSSIVTKVPIVGAIGNGRGYACVGTGNMRNYHTFLP